METSALRVQVCDFWFWCHDGKQCISDNATMTAVPAGQQIRMCKPGCLLSLRCGVSTSWCNTVIPVRKHFYSIMVVFSHCREEALHFISRGPFLSGFALSRPGPSMRFCLKSCWLLGCLSPLLCSPQLTVLVPADK